MNKTFSDFFLRFKKLRIAFTIPISTIMLIWILSSLITISGQTGDSGQEKPKTYYPCGAHRTF